MLTPDGLARIKQLGALFRFISSLLLLRATMDKSPIAYSSKRHGSDRPLSVTPLLELESRNGDAEMTRRVNRKLDLAILPLLSLLYLFNGLDRGNIGNAQTQGDTPGG
jgi:hypothetical protein